MISTKDVPVILSCRSLKKSQNEKKMPSIMLHVLLARDITIYKIILKKERLVLKALLLQINN